MPIFFLHPFTPHVGPLNLVTCKEAAPTFTGYTGPLDRPRDLTTQKVRVANKHHKKSNFVISWFITICNERKMVCWGAERRFIVQMAIIKQSETFWKLFGFIGLTSGGKGKTEMNLVSNIKIAIYLVMKFHLVAFAAHYFNCISDYFASLNTTGSTGWWWWWWYLKWASPSFSLVIGPTSEENLCQFTILFWRMSPNSSKLLIISFYKNVQLK